MPEKEFTTPKLDDYITVPPVELDAMAHSSPFVAAPKHQEALGFPGELVDDWETKAVEKMGDLLKLMVLQEIILTM